MDIFERLSWSAICRGDKRVVLVVQAAERVREPRGSPPVMPTPVCVLRRERLHRGKTDVSEWTLPLSDLKVKRSTKAIRCLHLDF